MTRSPLAAAVLCALLLAAVLSAGLSAWAWYPAKDTQGPLTVAIADFPDVQALDTPMPTKVTLENSADRPLSGRVRLEVTDEWRVEGANPQAFDLPAKGKAELTFSVVAGQGSYAAHYPIHAYATFDLDGKATEAHAVLVTKILPAAVKVVGTATAPQGLGRLVALRAEGPVALEAGLEGWTNAIPVPLGEAQRSLGTVAPGEFAAILYLLHDDRNLYVGLRVTDKDIDGDDVTSRDLTDSDYLRLYLAATPPDKRKAATLDAEDLVLAIAPFAGKGPLVKVPEYGLKTRALLDPAAVRVVPKRTATGYDLVAAVPLALIGGSLGDGASLGMNLMLGNASAGRRAAELTVGAQGGEYWTSPAQYVTLELSGRTKDDGLVSLPLMTLTKAGGLSLDRFGLFRVQVAREGKPLKGLPVGWTGVDPESGATFVPGGAARPDQRPCISTHPPYRDGVGPMWADARFALPDIKPIKLTFATAIRDNAATEPPSDGVEWRVYASEEGDEFRQLFQRFSLAKKWEPAEVDLSVYAGKTITLRLWNGPGPANNTTCDSGYWAEPTLTVGAPEEPETPAEIAERHQRAVNRAKDALAGKTGHFQWLVSNSAGKFGVGWAAGKGSFADGALAFVSGDKSLVFDHFRMNIGGEDVGDWRSKARAVGGKAKWTPDGKMTTIMDFIELDRKSTVQVETSMFVEKGAFRIRFAMPVAGRDKRGDPRFTLLAVGPCDRKAKRVYAGFGNVIQDPEPFVLGEGGFGLSTRHIGADYDNGLSLVQASDVFPYRFNVNPEQKLYALETGHDATLSFIPSVKGAFAAARVYRDVSGFTPAGGVAKLKGKMVIDWWGGHDVGPDVRRAGAYGLNDSLFLMHAWQRWGYDYRLPDIYPPAGDPKDWADWVAACKETGMLYGVHDNYIDFYPDASGFSYKHILFNADGTPQTAWWNPGPEAQSYRWLPGAYNPWLERNLKLIKNGFAPSGYFIDVFSAIPLLDYYDQAGNFHTKMECGKHWGETFDTVRKTLGDNAPTISEAGHDGLVGHLDACQADHFSTQTWGWKCADSDRTPWHDMATHGSIILLGGGLGDRYAGGNAFSSWGSDDYLSDTIMGGRNPMCTGPCTRDTVKTYWLQHDICKALASQSFERHEFVGDDIHRQHTTFGGGAETWVNRGEETWVIRPHLPAPLSGDLRSLRGEGGTAPAPITLPKYGYYARSGETVSAIMEHNGLPVRYAHSPTATFVDASPDYSDIATRAPAKTRVVSARHLGDGKIEAEIEWNVLQPLPEGTVVFVHVSHDKAIAQGNERIAIHAPCDLPPEQLQQVGVHRCFTRFTIPQDQYDGEYRLRYGLFRPNAGGGRMAPIADLDGARVRGGVFLVTKEAGRIKSVEYKPELPLAGAPRANAEGKMMDFAAIKTNGAFRLLHSGKEWKVLPLQGSIAFQAEINLAGFGAKGKKVLAVTGVDQSGKKVSAEKFRQEGGVLKLNLSAEAFGYVIGLG